MKAVITAAAVLLTALTLAPQAQARDQGNWQRGDQNHGRYDNRSNGRPNWNDQGRDHGGWGQSRGWQGHNDWHGHDGWQGRDQHRWGRPDIRPYDYRYPRYYYDRPYYGYGSRYVYPPAYRSSYYYDCDRYYDYSCEDDGFSLLLSLPLHF